MYNNYVDIVSILCCLNTAAKYTREAGVRTLERRIAAVCRAVAVKVAEHSIKQKAAVNAATEAEEKESSDVNTKTRE